MGLVSTLAIFYLVLTLVALPKWPELALGAQLFGKPIYAMAISKLGLPIGAAVLILGIVIVALFFYSLKDRGQNVFPFSKIEIIFFMLVIWVFITLSYTPSPIYGGDKMTELALIGVPCAITARVFGSSPERLEFTLKVVGIYAFCTFLILAAFSVLVGTGENSIRMQSQFFGPLGLGYSSVAMTITLVYLAFNGTYVVRLAAAFSMFYCIVVFLVGSGSRGPVLGLLVALALTFLRARQILRTLTVAGVVTAVGYFALINFASESGLARILGDESASRSNDSRLYFYEVGLEQFATSPLLGQGVGSFSTFLSGADRKQYPHNYFIEVGGELGLLGIAMYLSILTLCTLSLMRVRRYVGSGGDVGYWAIIVIQLMFYAGFIGSMFSGDISKQRVFYIGMGLVAGISRWAWVDEAEDVKYRPPVAA